MADENAGAAGAGDGTGGTGGTPASWFAGVDNETTGYLQNRGWDKLPADKAALEAIKAHREAEKFLGVPAEKIVRLPKDDTDVAGWNEVHTKLGVPAKADEYDVSGVKFSSGNPLGEKEVGEVKQMAADLKLTKPQAVLLAQRLVKIAEDEGKSTIAEQEGKLAAEAETLKKNWGSSFSGNKSIAEETMKKLGIPEEAINALAKTAGYAATMEAFRNIGVRIGEDKFVTANDGRGAGVMTRDEAQFKLSQLQNDSLWYDKFSKGDVTALREFDALTKILAGV